MSEPTFAILQFHGARVSLTISNGIPVIIMLDTNELLANQNAASWSPRISRTNFRAFFCRSRLSLPWRHFAAPAYTQCVPASCLSVADYLAQHGKCARGTALLTSFDKLRSQKIISRNPTKPTVDSPRSSRKPTYTYLSRSFADPAYLVTSTLIFAGLQQYGSCALLLAGTRLMPTDWLRNQ